jgi:hypothetical protein
MASQSQIQFVNWVKQHDPFLYRVAAKRLELQRSGLGFMDSVGSLFTSIVDTAKTVIPVGLEYNQQKKILALQLERAKQGLPPIDAAAYSPVVKIAPTFTPESEAAITRAATASLKEGGGAILTRMLPVAMMAVAAFFLLGRRRR